MGVCAEQQDEATGRCKSFSLNQNATLVAIASSSPWCFLVGTFCSPGLRLMRHNHDAFWGTVKLVDKRNEFRITLPKDRGQKLLPEEEEGNDLPHETG